MAGWHRHAGIQNITCAEGSCLLRKLLAASSHRLGMRGRDRGQPATWILGGTACPLWPPANVTVGGGWNTPWGLRLLVKGGERSALEPQRANLMRTSPSVSMDSSGAEERQHRAATWRTGQSQPGLSPGSCPISALLGGRGGRGGKLPSLIHMCREARERACGKAGDTGHTKGQGQTATLGQGPLVTLACQFPL